MRRASTRALGALALCAAGALALGCERAADGESGADAAPAYGGTAVVGGHIDLGALNSLVAVESITQDFLKHVLFLTLVAYDADLDYVPRLAESWRLEGDSAVLFRLRGDVRWHDGEPTTAEDVAFTFRRARDAATAFPDAVRFARWRDVEVIDSLTLRFRIEPHPEPLAAWVETAIMPAHLLESIPPEELRNAPFNRRPVGNGPFRFSGRSGGDRVEFVANSTFPEALGGRPNLDRLVYTVIPDGTARVAELLTERVDVVLNLPMPQLPRLQEAEGVRVIEAESRQLAFLGWNLRRPPLDRSEVRRALTMAIDRERMIRLLRSGFGTPALGPVPPSHWAYADDLEPLPHDADAARRLLDDAGLRDRDGDGIRELPRGEPFAIELKYPGQDEVFRNAAELIRADLERVGVRVVPRATEGATLIGDVTSSERRFDAVLLTLEIDIRPNLRDFFHSGALAGPFQLAGFSDERVDGLIDSLAVTVPREQSLPLWRGVQEVLRDEQPWTFLYYFPVLAGTTRRLRGVEMDVRSRLIGVERWWIPDQDRSASP